MNPRSLLFYSLLLSSCTVLGNQNTPPSQVPKRPTIMFNRWQEDWSVLANPNVPREPFDELKYIPLSKTNPQTYLSFGINLRERFESNDAVNFDVGNSVPQSYVISRFEQHIDLHIANKLQSFVQFQSDFSPWKTIITPVDQDRLDLEQAFTTLVEPIAGGTFKFRTGRQQFAFDLQRFVSVRDGPNVRLSYDAIWGDYEHGAWRFISFYSRPVVTLNLRAFDDYSSSHYTFSGFRVERKVQSLGKINSYIAHFKQDNVHYVSVSGNERRTILDARIVGKGTAFDWDLEFMGQEGSIANKQIRAWAMGSRSGYTLNKLRWSPRLGLQVDAASGNHNPHGKTFGTFNPLFPNGYYVTLSGYTGYSNFVHLKPSFSLQPNPSFTAMIAAAALWRETIADAVYTQPIIPVPGTAGEGGRFTGHYYQLRFDWLISRHFTGALEAVHYQVAESIRAVGGKNSNYVGVQIQFGW
ncbi:MAG: alginate export family protein [Legionella sp.]|uniref:alginate export family protein n=1 Tax=Legionella sp. TaxID=459 RepID=UPI002851DE74|nr:alginate export family protein [Legionella sp.]